MRPPARIFLRRRRRCTARTAKDPSSEKMSSCSIAAVMSRLWPGRDVVTAAASLCCPDKQPYEPNDQIDRQLDGGKRTRSCEEDSRVARRVLHRGFHRKFVDARIKTVSLARKAEQARVRRADKFDRIMLRLHLIGAPGVDRHKVISNITKLAEDEFGWREEKRSTSRYRALFYNTVFATIWMATTETDPVVLVWLLRLLQRLGNDTLEHNFAIAYPFDYAAGLLENPTCIRILRVEALRIMVKKATTPYWTTELIPRVLFSLLEQVPDDQQHCMNFAMHLALKVIAALLDMMGERGRSDTAAIADMCRNRRVMRLLFRVGISSDCCSESGCYALSCLAYLMHHGDDADRAHAMRLYASDMPAALAKCNSMQLWSFGASDSIAAIMVEAPELLDNLFRQMKGGRSEYPIFTSRVSARLLRFGLDHSPIVLQQLLGMDFLEGARGFANISRDVYGYVNDAPYAAIYQRVLVAHPEYKQRFRQITANPQAYSHTARLGLAIPVRQARPATTYVLTDAVGAAL